MLRREVSPKAVAVAVVVVLAVVQLFYWRLLVYRPPGRPPGPGGGGPMQAAEPAALGLEEVQVDTLVGDEPGYADGPAWRARFCGPNALALDRDGTLLVTDSRNHRLRRVTAAGTASTVAGEADGKPFLYPSGVAVGPDGAVYVADTGNGRICRLLGGRASRFAGGDGSLPAPATLAFGADGALWVRDAADAGIRRVDAAGGVSRPPAAPPEVHALLGGAAATGPLAAWDDARSEPQTTEFVPGRRSAAVGEGSLPPIYADVEFGGIFMQPAGQPPLLLAGRRPPVAGGVPSDGGGNRAGFGVPAAVVAAPGGVLYVAEYEGNCIRRVRLPQWLVEGQLSAPGRRGAWRGRRGS